MKRFIETTDWRDPRYRRLSPQAKQLRRYLWDNCDCAGVIAADFEAISFHVGEPIEEQHLTELGNWTETLADGRLLIPSFIHFQSGDLSDACRAHLPILKTIRAHNLVRSGTLYHQRPDSLSDELPLLPDRGQLQLTEQLKEQEQLPEQLTALPENLRTVEFQKAWTDWKTFRSEIRHKLTDQTIQRQLKQLSLVGQTRAIATIELSISNGWQGLFPEKTHETHQRNSAQRPQRTTGADQRQVGIPDAAQPGKLSELLADRARKSTTHRVAAKTSAPERGQSGGSTHG